MTKTIGELEDVGYTLQESDNPTRLPIDFAIVDKDGDEVASVWGDRHGVDWECSHPYNCIDFGDDDEQGQCELCGSFCHWHREESSDDGYIISEPVPHEWVPRRDVDGLIKKILDEMKEN